MESSIREASRPRSVVLVLAAALVLIGLGACREAPSTQGSEPTLPVGSLQDVMDAMVIPTSAALWNVAREAPADERAWEELESAAVLMGEAGNVLLMEGRLVDDEVWRTTSRSLAEAGRAAFLAARARDVDGVIDAGNLAVDSCELCHERHLNR